jgi:uncharacterized membrane protein
LTSKTDIISNGFALATNADGSVVAGQVAMPSGGGAFRWNASEGVVSLGLDSGSAASGVSSTGIAIVGTTYHLTSNSTHLFRWTPAAGVVDLSELKSGGANGVSGDGTVIVGSYFPGSAQVAFRWTQNTGLTQIGDPGGAATAISIDGSTIVGAINGAFRYFSGTGFSYLSLGNLTTTDARAVNGDGSVVVGRSDQGSWIWDTAHGARLLADVLTDLKVDLSRWTDLEVTAISADGKVLSGNGNKDAAYTSWIARL